MNPELAASEVPSRITVGKVLLMIVVVLVIAAGAVLIRSVVISTSYSEFDDTYSEYPVFNFGAPLIMALVIRGIVSPKRRTLIVPILALLILVPVTAAIEYLVVRTLVLQAGVSEKFAPLIPSVDQFRLLMTDNEQNLLLAGAGIVAGVLFAAFSRDLSPRSRST